MFDGQVPLYSTTSTCTSIRRIIHLHQYLLNYGIFLTFQIFLGRYEYVEYYYIYQYVDFYNACHESWLNLDKCIFIFEIMDLNFGHNCNISAHSNSILRISFQSKRAIFYDFITLKNIHRKLS